MDRLIGYDRGCIRIDLPAEVAGPLCEFWEAATLPCEAKDCYVRVWRTPTICCESCGGAFCSAHLYQLGEGRCLCHLCLTEGRENDKK